MISQDVYQAIFGLLAVVATAVFAFATGFLVGAGWKRVPQRPEPPHGNSVGHGTANAIDLAKQHTPSGPSDSYVYGFSHHPLPEARDQP